MSEELPFELYKKHKSNTIYNWKYKGLIESDEMIEEIYEYSIRSSNCELCGEAFKSLNDRHMDHDHITGKFRNIVCRKCNFIKKDKKLRPTNTGERYISKVNIKNILYYKLEITRNHKSILRKYCKTLEEAIEVRDKFILENPDTFK